MKDLPPDLPVLGICGPPGAGKTTLIEQALPLLRDEGLRVAVIKYGAHGLVLEPPGKDSARFFAAGADVCLLGQEYCLRRHLVPDLEEMAAALARDCDLVLVEGHGGAPGPRVWLSGPRGVPPPMEGGTVVAAWSLDEAGPERLAALALERARAALAALPVWGCILIGGRSRRMGYPKHLITRPDRSAWIERTAAVLAPFCQGLAISGRGDLPPGLPPHARLPDPPGLAGPLAGIVAALRHHPRAAWLLVACDQPDISAPALAWLLEQRAPAVRAILPDLCGEGKVEPLLALYEPRCQAFLEGMALRGDLRISRVARAPGAAHPRPPADLVPAWRNVNRPGDLQSGDAGPNGPGRAEGLDRPDRD